MALEELSFQEDESAAEIEQSMWMDEHLQQDTNRGVLNQAMDDITGGRVSPIQSTLNTEWSDISERQRNYYTRKAKEVIDTTLSTLAPGQESELWDSVLRAKKQDSSSYEDRLKKLYGETVLSNLIDAYNQAQTWSTRRQILSLFVHDFTGPELQHMIPGITAWRISEARKHAASSGMGQPVDKKVDIRARLDPVKTDHFVEFMSRPDYIQNVAYGTKKMRLDLGEELIIPGAIRTMIPARIIKQYQSHCERTNFTPLSVQTLYNILNVCSASTQKSLQGLDYITTKGSDSFDELFDVVNTLAANGAPVEWATQTRCRLKTGKRYLKIDFKTHVQKTDRCPDHCIKHALSDPKNTLFAESCEDHDHSLTCDRCHDIKQTMTDIADMIASTDVRLTEEQRSRLQYEQKQATEDILAWKRHLLRTVHQEAAKQSALKALDSQTVFIVMDWAMKYMPRKFREHHRDFFGKRGVNWHVAAVIAEGDDEKSPVQCLVHILDNCTQN